MKLSPPQAHVLKHMTAGWTLSSDAKNEPFMRSGIATQSVSTEALRALLRLGLVRGLSLYPITMYVMTEAGRKAIK